MLPLFRALVKYCSTNRPFTKRNICIAVIDIAPAKGWGKSAPKSCLQSPLNFSARFFHLWLSVPFCSNCHPCPTIILASLTSLCIDILQIAFRSFDLLLTMRFPLFQSFVVHVVDTVLSNFPLGFPVDMVCLVCHSFGVSFHGPYSQGRVVRQV